MHDLLIAWPGGKATFSPADSPVAVGRSADAAIVLTDPAISRRHLEFVWLGSSWIANDSSTHGSYDPIGIRLAPTWTVGDAVVVRLGGIGGTEVKLSLTDAAAEAEQVPPPAAPPVDLPAPPVAEPAPPPAPPVDLPAPPAAEPAPPPALPVDPPAPPVVESAPPALPVDLPDPDALPPVAPEPPSAPLVAPEPAIAAESPSTSSLAPPMPESPIGLPAPAMAGINRADAVAVADHEVLLDHAPSIEAPDLVSEPSPVLDPPPPPPPEPIGESDAVALGFESPNNLPLPDSPAPPSIFDAPANDARVNDAPGDAVLSNDVVGEQISADQATAPLAPPSIFDEAPAPPEPQIYNENVLESLPAEAEDAPPPPPAPEPRSSILEDAEPPSPPEQRREELPEELLAELEQSDNNDPEDTFTFRSKGAILAPQPDIAEANGAGPLSELEELVSPAPEAVNGSNGHHQTPPPIIGRDDAAPSIFSETPRQDPPDQDPPQPPAPAGWRNDLPPMPPGPEFERNDPATQAVPRIEPLVEPEQGIGLPAESLEAPVAPPAPEIPSPVVAMESDLPSPVDLHNPAVLDDEVDEPFPAAVGASPDSGSWDDFMAAQPDEDEWAGPPTAADTIISDNTVQISIDGQNFAFVPGVEVTVGRDPSCLVNLDERHSLVSRNHLTIQFSDDHWWIDDHSSKGTYIDGRKISSRYKAEGAFLAHLGDDDAGTPMRIITAGEHKAPRSFNFLLVLAVTALLMLAIAALAYVLLGSRGGGEEATDIVADGQTTVAAVAPPPGADLVLAKQATVLLLSEAGFGSGFFVTDNLIVTNQHVAVLDDSLAVAVSRTVDEPAQVEFLAETVAVHPYLDIAVMQLTVDGNDDVVSSSGLNPVPIGDSGGLTLGDEVYNTGFPQDLSPAGFDDMGDILLPAVSTTSGEAANFSIWPGCSNPTRDEFIPAGSPPGVGCAPDGDVTRAVVITTFSSGEGASGSPVFSNNAVVAVVFSGPEGNENAGRNIATAAFADWLDEVIADNS